MLREIRFPDGTTRTIRVHKAADPKPPGVRVVRIKTPSLLKQAWSYAKAVAQWRAAGSPSRTQEEIDRILAICRACPFYSERKRPHCTMCGCALNAAPNGLANKIAMATESCPLVPPKWSADAAREER